MKKIIFIAVLMSVLASCRKQYECERTFTKTYNGIIVHGFTENYSVDEISCTPCNNFEYTNKDTIVKMSTVCR